MVIEGKNAYLLISNVLYKKLHYEKKFLSIIFGFTAKLRLVSLMFSINCYKQISRIIIIIDNFDISIILVLLEFVDITCGVTLCFVMGATKLLLF